MHCPSGISCGTTRRFPARLHQHRFGASCRPVSQRISRFTRRRSAGTGHGGFDGSNIDNLTITPANFDGLPAEASHIIPNARRLAVAPDLFAMTAIDSAYVAASTLVVQVRDFGKGLQSGRWLPPVQRGSGRWKSPWLQLGEPNRAFRLLRVDATS